MYKLEYKNNEREEERFVMTEVSESTIGEDFVEGKFIVNPTEVIVFTKFSKEVAEKEYKNKMRKVLKNRRYIFRKYMKEEMEPKKMEQKENPTKEDDTKSSVQLQERFSTLLYKYVKDDEKYSSLYEKYMKLSIDEMNEYNNYIELRGVVDNYNAQCSDEYKVSITVPEAIYQNDLLLEALHVDSEED